MKKKVITIPIYHNQLVVIKCDDLQEVAKKYNLGDVSSYGAFVFKLTNKDGRKRYVAAFDKDYTGSLIAHECVHLVNEIYIDRGIQLDRQNDEPQAYLTGWLFEQCEKFLNNN